MRNGKFIALLTIVIACSSFGIAFSQRDSLKVFFVGYGFVGERYKVYHHNRELLTFIVKGKYVHSFSIPIGTDWKYGTPMSINVERRGKVWHMLS
jgi:hypothetical protein